MSSDPASRVRDAMIADPRSLPATASARDAGEVLTPAEVRAVYVVGPDGEPRLEGPYGVDADALLMLDIEVGRR